MRKAEAVSQTVQPAENSLTERPHQSLRHVGDVAFHRVEAVPDAATPDPFTRMISFRVKEHRVAAVERPPVRFRPLLLQRATPHPAWEPATTHREPVAHRGSRRLRNPLRYRANADCPRCATTGLRPVPHTSGSHPVAWSASAFGYCKKRYAAALCGVAPNQETAVKTTQNAAARRPNRCAETLRRTTRVIPSVRSRPRCKSLRVHPRSRLHGIGNAAPPRCPPATRPASSVASPRPPSRHSSRRH